MTDIICGFPGESENDFQETFDLVENYAFGLLNISQFYARPGTPAAKMRPRVPTATVKARSRRLTALSATFRPYDGLVGSVKSCSSCAEIADGGRRLVAHTASYVKVLAGLRRRTRPSGPEFDLHAATHT